MNVLLSQLLTNSRLKTARACARLHQFMYLLGYRPTEDRAELAFGDLLHKALEAWWLAVKAALPVDDWYANAITALRAVEGVDPFDLVKAEVLMAGYHARWAADALLYEVLGVEQRFEFALINPETGGRSPLWRVGGKLDVRLKKKSDGTTGFMEHKSSGEDVSQGGAYWQVLMMDSQISIYFDGASSLGDDAQWCEYDVIGKPGQRPSQVAKVDEHGNPIVLDAHGERVKAQGGKWRKTGDSAQGYVLQKRDETPEEYRVRLLEALIKEPDRYFVRGTVVRFEAELAEARHEIWQQAASLRESINADRFVRNNDNCRRGHQLCPFFGVCTGTASLDNPQMFTRTNDVHPELAGHPTSAAGPKEGLTHDDSSEATETAVSHT